MVFLYVVQTQIKIMLCSYPNSNQVVATILHISCRDICNFEAITLLDFNWQKTDFCGISNSFIEKGHRLEEVWLSLDKWWYSQVIIGGENKASMR